MAFVRVLIAWIFTRVLGGPRRRTSAVIAISGVSLLSLRLRYQTTWAVTFLLITESLSEGHLKKFCVKCRNHHSGRSLRDTTAAPFAVVTAVRERGRRGELVTNYELI